MKKFAKITAVALVVVMVMALLVACGYNSDPKKAEADLKKQGYDALYVPNPLTVGNVEGTLTATKKDGNKTTTIVVTYYRDADAAKSAYEDAKANLEKAKDYNKEHNIKATVSRAGVQVISKSVKTSD